MLNPVGYSAQEDHSSLLTFLYKSISSPIWQGFLSSLIVFIQALLINRLVIKHSITRENTLIPGLLYILLSAFMPEFLTLSPILIGMSFIIIACYIIMKTYNQKEAAKDMFTSGFMIGLAGIVYFPLFSFVIVSFLAFLILKSFTLKDRIQHFIGFFTPICLLLAWEIFTKYENPIIPHYFTANFKPSFTLLIQDMKGIFVSGVIIVFVVVFLFNYSKYMSQKATGTQRKIDILYWVSIFSLFSILFTNKASYSHILILAFPLAIFLTMSLLSFKNKILAEIVHLFMIIFAIMIQFKVVEL
jgi:hypothetical protein